MTEITTNITRRQALSGLGGVSALALLPGCAQTLAETEGLVTTGQQLGAERLLEQVAWNLLQHEPERATGLGVDTGEHADLRGKLTDTSPAGQAAYAKTLSADLELVRRYPREGLDSTTVTNLDVVESAYRLALDGFALPYGDTPVGNWRTAPYVVIQNVGAYLGLPRFMDSIHPLRDSGDIEAYLSRLVQVSDVLDGELTRMQQARAMGVVPPYFLLDKALGQMEATLTDSMGGGALLDPLLKSDLAAATTASPTWPWRATQSRLPPRPSACAKPWPCCCCCGLAGRSSCAPPRTAW